jgi:DNA-3-methyladenine glycosylase II
LEKRVDPLEPRGFLALTDKELRQIGFSRQKTRYGRELANTILDGSLDLQSLG